MRGGKVYSKFYSGEFSQWLRGQFDLQAYQFGLDTLYNAYVQKYGPISRRTGTRLVSVLDTGTTSNCRLVPFTVNEDTVYVLEFTHERMRVIYPDGDYVLNPDGSIYELPTPFTSEQLFKLHMAQSSDVLFVVHGDIFPRQLSHYGPNNWVIGEMDILDGPYFAENADKGKTVTPSGTSGTVTLTANFDLFVTNDVDRLFRLKESDSWTWMKITSVTNARTATATIKGDALKATSASYEWRLGSFCKDAGYPSAITFHQERLWVGGTKSQPQSVWGSVSSDFSNFAPTDVLGDVLDDSSIAMSMLSDETNIIQWMKSDNVLNVGTLGAEFKIFAYDSEAVLTPHTAQAMRVTSLGSEAIEPIAMPIGTVFVQRSGRKLRHAIFTNILTEDETPADLNIWAPHIAEQGFKHIAFEQEPNGIIWAVTNNGELSSLTYDAEQKVMGWARHKLAGTQAKVHHICVIPVKTALQYRLFCVVDRLVDGVVVRSIEYKTNDPISTTDQRDMIYTDYSYHYERINTISNLTYNQSEGSVFITLADDGKHVVFNEKGIRWESTDMPEDGDIIKIAKFQSEAPDIPEADYTTMTHLSDILGDRLYKLEAQGNNRFKLLTKYGADLPDVFKDCYNDVTTPGVARFCVTELTGLDAWENRKVQILADGAVLEEQIVTDGTLDLQNEYGSITIGLGYRTKIKTLPVAVPTESQEITAMWTIKIIKAFVNLWRSLGFKYGVEETNMCVEPFRATLENMDEPTPLYTGVKDITVGDVTENKGQIILIQDQPLPLNVLSVGLKLDATDV